VKTKSFFDFKFGEMHSAVTERRLRQFEYAKEQRIRYQRIQVLGKL
jgi:hypothetical protein